MKDPETFGSTEAAKENIDDMIVGSQGNPRKLQVLLQFFQEMIRIAEPFTNPATGAITAPKGRLPIEQLLLTLRQTIGRIDGAFVETMSYTCWIQVFQEGIAKAKKRLGPSGEVSETNERLR